MSATHRHGHADTTTHRTADDTTGVLSLVSHMGFSWPDVARISGLTDDELDQCRAHSELPVFAIERLRKFIADATTIYLVGVNDPTVAFSVPISDRATVTPLDLWCKGQTSRAVALITSAARD